ncbi:hypothetical protein BDR06DRAFT_968982 [Suillus hirtellus]|nr:hypothetical protein BDR06DRAFT_968982 [Suillus hirtellus]
MAPPRWMSTKQLIWLQNELPNYLQMQKEKKLPQFFELLFSRWFNHFPEEIELNSSPPCVKNTSIDEHGRAVINSIIETAQPDIINEPESTEQEDSESNSQLMQAGKQHKEWFQNNSKGKTIPGSSSTSKALSALLGQHVQGTQDHKEVEVYSKLHYESKVKPLVSDALKNNPVQPTQRLSTVWQHTTDCFADELDKVKKEIQEETIHLNAARRLGDVVRQDLQTKEEVYKVDPLCEGNIMMLSYHHSKTADGLSFKACTPNFYEQYLSPFERHLGHIYGASSKSMLPVAPSSIPTSPCLLPGLISLKDETTSPHLPPGLISLEDKSLVGNVLDPSLDFNTLAGMKEHDMPITAWRKSTAFDEDLLTISPTFNCTEWPGVSMVDPSVEAIPPLMFHPLSSFHTTLLPQPALLLAQQMNQFSALEKMHQAPTASFYQGTKPTPKRKQTEVQHSGKRSKKKSCK